MADPEVGDVVVCTLVCKGFDPQTFYVSQWRGEEALSRSYRFDVEVGSRDSRLVLERLRGTRATLTLMAAGGRHTPYHGVLTQAAVIGDDDHYTYYRFVLEPRLARLRQFRRSAVYLDLSVADLIRQTLRKVELTRESDVPVPGEDADFAMTLSGGDVDKTRVPFACQYEESDLDFLSRRLEHEGVYYYFSQTREGEVVVFCNHRERQPQTPLAQSLHYRPNGSLRNPPTEVAVETFTVRCGDTPSAVVLNEYASSHASLTLQGLAEVPQGNFGNFVSFGEHFDTQRDAAHLAALRAERLDCEALSYEGTSATIGPQVGFAVTLSGHFRSELNQRYWVCSVAHEGSQPLPLLASVTQNIERNYRSRFTLLRATQQFRPALCTPKPRIAAWVSAVIDGQGGLTQPEIDEHGRYRVRFAFAGASRPGRGSAWLRLATPYAGVGHGMHFPLYNGTEVLVAFINGDPDRPVIAAAVHNSEYSSVADQHGPTRNALQSAGGNRMTMEDANGKQAVMLSSPTAGAVLSLGHGPRPGVSVCSDQHMAFSSHTFEHAIGGVYRQTISSSSTSQRSAPTQMAATHGMSSSAQKQFQHAEATASNAHGQWGDFEQGAGVYTQDFWGETQYNYVGNLNESVQGISSILVTGVSIDVCAGVSFTRLADRAYEYNNGRTDFTAADHEWAVAQAATFNFGSHILNTTSAVYSIKSSMTTSAMLATERFSTGKTTTVGAGETMSVLDMSPVLTTIKTGDSSINVWPTQVSVKTGICSVVAQGAILLEGESMSTALEGAYELTSPTIALSAEALVSLESDLISLG
ncbi:type VI secretion system Vgr family protein [Pandoraea iniqua]|nr:type VI secretion system tip protein TssI/VgrG [Pandoraea iniqua]